MFATFAHSFQAASASTSKFTKPIASIPVSSWPLCARHVTVQVHERRAAAMTP
jgi:hypothetical protein